MLLRYKLDQKSLAIPSYENHNDVLTIMDNFKYSFNAVCFLLKKVFEINRFTVEVVNEDRCYKLVMAMEFLIKANNKILRVSLKDQDIIVTDETSKYSFSFEHYPKESELILKEMNVSLQDRIIGQHFLDHKVVLEIHFKDNQKSMSLILPVDTERTFDLDIFQYIKSIATICDFKKFYINTFQQMQGAYDIENSETILSIWQRLKDSYDLDNAILVDELVLRDNTIQNYQLGLLYNTEDGNLISVILKDGIYTINGFGYDPTFDINSSLINLLERQRNLK